MGPDANSAIGLGKSEDRFRQLATACRETPAIFAISLMPIRSSSRIGTSGEQRSLKMWTVNTYSVSDDHRKVKALNIKGAVAQAHVSVGGKRREGTPLCRDRWATAVHWPANASGQLRRRDRGRLGRGVVADRQAKLPRTRRKHLGAVY